MKLSQRQTQLLATQIRETLLKQKVSKLSDFKKKELKEFFEKRDELVAIENAAKSAVTKHDSLLFSISGKNHRVRGYNGYQEAVKEMESKNTPSVKDIEDKIILKSMFATDQDMDSFIESIVKEYAKPKKVVQDN